MAGPKGQRPGPDQDVAGGQHSERQTNLKSPDHPKKVTFTDRFDGAPQDENASPRKRCEYFPSIRPLARNFIAQRYM